MLELMKVEAVPAKLALNFDELRGALSKELAKYEIVVTQDTVAGAKKLAVELNKTAKTIDDRRKDEVAKASEPVRQFDTQMKDLVGLCKDGRQKILDQVQKFEDETREKARELLEAECARLWEVHGVRDEFRRAEYDDLILLTSVTAKGALAAKAREGIGSRVIADKMLQDRTERRLLELENASHRAGLSAPLTRGHVEHFLFTEDDAYTAHLNHVLDVEVARQEKAEQAMRERIEREQRQKEEAERQERERRERIEATKKLYEPTEPEVEGRPQRGQPVPPPKAETEAQREPKPEAVGGPCLITCSFRVDVPDGTPDAVVEAQLRKMLAKAGFTTLESVTIERPRNDD